MNTDFHRFLLSIFLILANSLTQAATSQFVSQFLRISSTNPQISDKQCQDLFSEPVYYSIENGRSIFKKNRRFTISTNQRLLSLFVDADHQLFLEKETIEFSFNQPTQTEPLYIYFMLDRPGRSILGGWYIPGYCKGFVEGHDIGMI